MTTRADSAVVAAANELHQAFAAGEAALLHADVTLTDMSLRTSTVGRIETEGYMGRVLPTVPYGRGSTLRHVVGGAAGGAFEWTSADGLVGITAIDLDDSGLITSITSVYDSRQLPVERKTALVQAALPD